MEPYSEARVAKTCSILEKYSEANEKGLEGRHHAAFE
jgi:hypothetical protein